MTKRTLVFALWVVSLFNIYAKNTSFVSGKVIDNKQKQVLPGATVMFISLVDSLKKQGTISGSNGTFSLELPKNKYALSVSFMGFKTYTDTLNVGAQDVELPTIMLTEDDALLEEVKIVETQAPAIQRGDTTLYDPDGYKVHLDATTRDLLNKMPGFFEIEGTLMAMGDTIREVLVDGKKYFRSDISRVLQFIPVKIIKKIVVYPYESDEAKKTGFQETTGGMTVNIITNLDSKALVRVQVAAGYGKDDRYAGEGNYNRIKDKSVISVNAEKRNVDVPLRVGKYSAGGSISGNKIENENLSARVGLERANMLNVRCFSRNNNSWSNSYNNREYLSGVLLGQTYSQNSASQKSSNGNDFDFIWGSNPKNKNSFMTALRFGNNDSKSANQDESVTHQHQELVNTTTNYSYSNNTNYDISANVNYTRKLNDKGRALTLVAKYDNRKSQKDRQQNSNTTNSDGSMVQDIKQTSKSENKSDNVSFGISLKEKLGKKGALSVGYNYRNHIQESDKKSMDFNETTSAYDMLDSLTSNTFENKSHVHVGRLAYQIRNKKTNLNAGVNITKTILESNESFPDIHYFDEGFLSFQPNLIMSYTTKTKRRISFSYNLKQQIPSISRLQDIVDNTNPMYISTGNPNLKLSSTHSFIFSSVKTNIKRKTFTRISFRAGMTNNMVTTNRIVAVNDTVVLGSYLLPAGGQFSRPVNLDGRLNMGLDMNQTWTSKKLKCKINSKTGINYNTTPNILNNVKSNAQRFNLSQGFSVSSNINEKIDFTMNTRSAYSIVENDNKNVSRNNYFSQNSSLNLYWNFFKRYIFKTDANHTYRGSSGVLSNNNRVYINLSLSKKLFEDNQGEIALSAYDLTNNQNELTRDINDIYISESYRPVLNKFYMVSFTYSL